MLARMKEKKFLRLYGITIRERDRILESQGYKCANLQCLRSIPEGGHFDHDHKTKKNRGILCPQCNMALGLLADSCECLLGLVDYLNKQEESNGK